ncbi:MAG: S-methyl-5'-thioadenosine phosphorylase [archaeon]|jgi:5'-methylthioadenosine phosphorylase
MIGIIGGSGLEDPQILQDAKEVTVETPYGKHTPIKVGKIGSVNVAILSRHGYFHEYSPSSIPYKANIHALFKLGCKAIVATSACGSLKEEIAPGTLSFPDQFIDMTTKREQSFTEHGKVIHESMAEPFDKHLRTILEKTCEKIGYEYSCETTIITIEGSRFSTKAESNMFRMWGGDLINMTTVPEVCLAKEMHIPYQVINLVTDYDCWREGTEAVTFEQVLKIMKTNAEKVKKLLIEALPEIKQKFVSTN